jgi:HEAT repeat protein
VVLLLKGSLDHPDQAVRSRILRSLRRCGYRAHGEETAWVQRQIRDEVETATWILAGAVDLGGDGIDDVFSLLQEALDSELERVRARIFYLLSFIYNDSAVMLARDTLRHSFSSAGKRAYALEIIDTLVSREHRDLLFPLLSDLPTRQRLQRLQANFPQHQVSCNGRLQEIIARPDHQISDWTRVCALYSAGRSAATELFETVSDKLSAPIPLMRETAAWTLLKLDPARCSGQIRELFYDPSPQVAQLARDWLAEPAEGLEPAGEGDNRMLSTIEKVIILKNASIFGGTPDDILAEVAQLLEDVELKRGETIFEKGDVGDCMYIVVDGEVRVHDGERTLNHMREGDVFGEMAILDAEPRVASVTAVEDTRLFRLNQEPFYELMDDRIEVARGIIRVLSQHLRDRVRDLNILRTRLEG